MLLLRVGARERKCASTSAHTDHEVTIDTMPCLQLYSHSSKGGALVFSTLGTVNNLILLVFPPKSTIINPATVDLPLHVIL